MLTPYSKPQFIERIITSKAGQQFRVVFYVALVNGEMKAKIVSATPVVAMTSESVQATYSTNLSLPAPRETIKVSFDYTPSFAPKVSPYFTLDFFVSQPTRAPSFN